MKEKVLVVLMGLVLVILIGNVSANYISGNIYILSNGDVTFSVETDDLISIPGLIFEKDRIKGVTSELTSKNKEIWTFTLDFGNYETIFLDVHLPNNLESIKSLEGVENIIDFQDKVISLIDENSDLYFKVEYELGKEDDVTIIYFLIIFLLLILVIFLFLSSRKKKQKKLQEIFPLINDKERNIIELLMKKPLRQKEIRKRLEIPKASFSRYLVNLEKKKLIIREGEGRNKVVKLK